MQFTILSALSALAFAALARSQTIDPSSVPLGIRTTWCTNQKASCPLLCTQINDGDSDTSANDCDPKTLGWDCVCSNGLQPNTSDFSQTIPFYECQQSNQQCANNCNLGDNACVTACQTAHTCGASDPHRTNVTSTASGTSTATGTASSTATNSAASGSDAAAATSAGSTGFFGAPASTSSSAASANFVVSPFRLFTPELYGLAAVLASFMAGFAVLL